MPPPAAGDGRIVIACPVTPHIANFDDLDPLRQEAGVDLRLVPPGQPIPADAALVILPGSKATIADLDAIRREGWDIDILAHRRRGGRVLGLCGGYQMLGRRVADPHGLEGPARVVAGLGLLDVETVLGPDKRLERVGGRMRGARLDGYEMHMGTTTGPDASRPLGQFSDGRDEGAMTPDGRVAGTYVHGLFGLAVQRAAWLDWIGATSADCDHADVVDAALDEIAAALEAHLDLDGLLTLAREGIRGDAPR